MTTSDWLTLASDAFTAIYVGFTLWLVIITRKSLLLAREQVKEAKIQLKEDREASERQSQAAIEAIREQIKASEQQAKEALYNQHKPVIVPVDQPSSSNAVQFSMQLENRGPGVALNTWGFLTFKGLPVTYHFVQLYFLIPGVMALIKFDANEIHYPTTSIAGHAIFPPADTSISANGVSSLPVDVRLTITYSDVFENKYLVIFDYIESLGWKQDTMKVIQTRLDEML